MNDLAGRTGTYGPHVGQSHCFEIFIGTSLEASFTIDGWIRLNAEAIKVSPLDDALNVIQVRSGTHKSAIVVEVDLDGLLRVIHRNPPQPVLGMNLHSQTNMTDGKWHHFAVVRGDDRKLHLYIDGVLEASSLQDADDFVEAPDPLFLGVNIEANPRFFRGLMDEMRFWNRARTEEEIKRNMTRSVDPKSEGLVAYYHFNQAEEAIDQIASDSRPRFAPALMEAIRSAR